MNACMHVCMYVCVCIYIHTHIHIYIGKQFRTASLHAMAAHCQHAPEAAEIEQALLGFLEHEESLRADVSSLQERRGGCHAPEGGGAFATRAKDVAEVC
jgi:hypothetical protein